MAFDCLFVILIYLPFTITRHTLDANAGISLPWVDKDSHRSPNLNSHGLLPPLDPNLGETIAAVDQTEVRTLPDNKGEHASTDARDRRWRSRQPPMRNGQFGFNNQLSGPQLGIPSRMPPTHMSNPFSKSSIIQNQHNFQNKHPNQSGLKDPHDMSQGSHIGRVISINPPGLQNTEAHIDGITQNRDQKSTSSNTNKPMTSDRMTQTNTKPANLLNGILQKIANNVVSSLVDRLVAAQGNQKPVITLPGTSSQSMVSGRGFSQPFSPVGHTHGPNGEVIPIHHGDHVHGSHGQVIPNSNTMPNRFGHRNSWNQNPFLHRSVQGSRRGWVLG